MGTSGKDSAPQAAQTTTILTTPIPEIEVPTSTPATMPSTIKVLSHANPKYELRYPSIWTLTTAADGSRELAFDNAISLDIKSSSLSGKTLKAFVDQKAAEMGGVFETSPVVATQAGALSGYSFHVKGNAEGDYYYFDVGTNSYLEIFDATKDPAGVGYKLQVQEVLNTLAI